MVILGIALLLVGLLTGTTILFWVGLMLILVGAVLWFGGPVDPTGHRRRYY